jgi:L-threonylcarbamoyladenylate synthase
MKINVSGRLYDIVAYGVRVPALGGALAPMAYLTVPVLQSSANRSGGADARRIEDVDPEVRAAASAELDGGELPGTASTVVDLSSLDETGDWSLLREGAVPRATVAAALD